MSCMYALQVVLSTVLYNSYLMTSGLYQTVDILLLYIGQSFPGPSWDGSCELEIFARYMDNLRKIT